MNLTVDQIKILLNGLTSLEGALGAISQPLPDGIADLKIVLRQQVQIEEQALVLQTAGHLTTEQVAEQLGCSLPWVRYLAKERLIHLARRGRRGRGFSSLYDVKSVEAYKKKASLKDTDHER